MPQRPPCCGSVSASVHAHICPPTLLLTMGYDRSTPEGVWGWRVWEERQLLAAGRGLSLSSRGPPSTGACRLPSVPASLIPNTAWQVLWLRGSRIRVWMWRWFIFVAGDWWDVWGWLEALRFAAFRKGSSWWKRIQSFWFRKRRLEVFPFRFVSLPES